MTLTLRDKKLIHQAIFSLLAVIILSLITFLSYYLTTSGNPQILGSSAFYNLDR